MSYKSKLFLLTALVVMVSFYAAYLIDNTIEIKTIDFQTFTNVVTVLSSVVLLILGLYVFMRFNGSQAIVDSQTKQVIDLVEKIANTRFSFDDLSSGKSVGVSYNVDVFNIDSRHDELGINLLDKSKEIVDTRFVNWLAFIHDTSNNPYLPKKIAQKVNDDFYVGVGTFIASETKKYVRVGVQGKFKDHLGFDDDGKLFEKINNQTISTKFYINSIIDIYELCCEWLKKHNPTVYESLNIKTTSKKLVG